MLLNMGMLMRVHRLRVSGNPILYIKDRLTDSRGLSVADYDNVASELQPVFFSDPNTLRSVAEIMTLMDASEYLNLGTMLSDGLIYVLYSKDTPTVTINRTLQYMEQLLMDQVLSDWFTGLDQFTDMDQFTDREEYV